MPSSSRPGRLETVALWPAGIAIVSWRYLWRTTVLHRSEQPGTLADLPEGWDRDPRDGGEQRLAAGSGPLLHRTYSVWIADATSSAAELMDKVTLNLNKATPEMASFRKTRGDDDALRAGDEYLVRMPGPWNGPVRVTRRDAASFRLVTLDGHLEAGEIEFRASAAGSGLCFEIESWARAGDRMADFLYNRLRLAKEVQLNMWTHFCLQAAKLSGGKPKGGITIATNELPWPPQSPGGGRPGRG